MIKITKLSCRKLHPSMPTWKYFPIFFLLIWYSTSFCIILMLLLFINVFSTPQSHFILWCCGYRRQAWECTQAYVHVCVYVVSVWVHVHACIPVVGVCTFVVHVRASMGVFVEGGGTCIHLVYAWMSIVRSSVYVCMYVHVFMWGCVCMFCTFAGLQSCWWTLWYCLSNDYLKFLKYIGRLMCYKKPYDHPWDWSIMLLFRAALSGRLFCGNGSALSVLSSMNCQLCMFIVRPRNWNSAWQMWLWLPVVSYSDISELHVLNACTTPRVVYLVHDVCFMTGLAFVLPMKP